MANVCQQTTDAGKWIDITVNNEYLKLWLGLLHWVVETRLLSACLRHRKNIFIHPQ